MRKKVTCKLRKDIEELLGGEDCDPTRLKFTADNRLALILDITELVHTYDYNAAKLKHSLHDKLRIENLRKERIVDFEHYDALLREQGVSLTKMEAELSCLIYNGFSMPLLRMVYGHGNNDTIYVLASRIKDKIARQVDAQADAVK